MTGQQRFAVAAAAIAVTAAAPAVAQNDAALLRLVAQQQDQIAEQKRLLEDQGRKLDQLAERLAAMETKERGAPLAVATPPKPEAKASAGQALADAGARTPSDDTREATRKPTTPPGRAVVADWKSGGPLIGSVDGFYTFHPRLRVMLDASTTRGSRYDARNISGTEGRSIFLGGEGTIGPMGYKVETDISSQEISLRETYLSYIWGAKDGVQKQVYLGSKINDRGIDASSADTLTPLMERNAVGVLTAGQRGFFGFGVMGRVLAENWHASLAISGDSASKEGTSDDTLTMAARAHWSPSLTADGFLHLGGWAYHERLSDGVAMLSRADPVSTRYNDNLTIDSGPLLNPRSGIGYGLEGGGVYRSGFLLVEYGKRRIHFDDRADAEFGGLSVYGGIFLTGETPNLSRRTGGWELPDIQSDFTDGGSGAFQLVARYDRYTLRNLALGGQGRSVSVGLNWYLNNWARLMVNYAGLPTIAAAIPSGAIPATRSARGPRSPSDTRRI